MVNVFKYLFCVAIFGQSCSYSTKSDVTDSGVDSAEKTIEVKDKVREDELFMTLTPNRFKATDKKIVTYTITNHSARDLNFGTCFHVERDENGTWKKIPFIDHFIFLKPLYSAPRGKSFTDSIHISVVIGQEQYRKGHYRIVKDVWLKNERDSMITLQSEFDIY